MKSFFNKMSLLAVLCLLSMGTSMAGPTGLVIRGGDCSAKAFKEGAELVQDDNITNLSVNCTNATSNKANANQYTAGIPHANVCVGTWESVVKAGGKVVKNPIAGNPLHCQVSGKASKLAQVLTR